MFREISISLFEKNLKAHNRMGLGRSYYTACDYPNEYIKGMPLGTTNKFAVRVVIDKEFVKEFQAYLKKKGFEIIGANNHYHIGNILADYYSNEKANENLKGKIEAIEKDYIELKENQEAYKLIENDDALFYFLPYNEKCETICEFVESIKTGLIKFAKNRDITIVMDLEPYCNLITGGVVFNALDEQENQLDFYSNIVLNVDLAIPTSCYAATLLMSGITKNQFDLEALNFHILAENIKYNK